jgi:hypothetical protein
MCSIMHQSTAVLTSAVCHCLLHSTGSSNARGLFSFHRHQQQQEQSPAAAAPADSSKAAATPAAPLSSSSGDATTNSNSSNPGGLNNTDIPVDVGTAMTQLLKHAFKNQTLPPLKDILFPHLSANGSRNASRKHNFTWSDLAPPNMTLKQAFANAFKEALGNVTNGMSVSDFAKALMTGTISSNTADTNTPDRGLADVQSGAININPFVNGAALSNALTLAGRDATANSKGIVFGMIGTGRASSQATALGINGAKSSTDTFSVNGGGLLGQNAMSSNLAATPHGRADTSVRSAAFNMVGQTATGGLTMAVGKKGAASAGLGAGMTGASAVRCCAALACCARVHACVCPPSAGCGLQHCPAAAAAAAAVAAAVPAPATQGLAHPAAPSSQTRCRPGTRAATRVCWQARSLARPRPAWAPCPRA